MGSPSDRARSVAAAGGAVSASARATGRALSPCHPTCRHRARTSSASTGGGIRRIARSLLTTLEILPVEIEHGGGREQDDVKRALGGDGRNRGPRRRLIHEPVGSRPAVQ